MATYGNKKVPFPVKGVYGYKGAVWGISELTIGAAGAISAQPTTKGGISAVKNAAAGRYALTVPSGYRHFFGGSVAVTGPSSAIYGANTVGGPSWFWRNNNIDRGTKAGTIDLQFCDSVNNADADLPSGTIVNITLFLGTGI